MFNWIEFDDLLGVAVVIGVMTILAVIVAFRTRR